jgi:hypothetical protein
VSLEELWKLEKSKSINHFNSCGNPMALMDDAFVQVNG